MTKQEEDARIAAAVQQQLQQIVAGQQKQFSSQLEKAVKDALKGVEKANAALRKERKAVENELDAARKLRSEAENEGDKMAVEYFSGRQKQFREAAKTELLRDLVCMHLEVGKSVRDIAVWLDVPLAFVENIKQLMQRAAVYYKDKPKRKPIEGNPVLRYQSSGRGGTIRFESRVTCFEMWWEIAGGSAIAIVDIPNPEQWEANTGLALEQRLETLTFIAEHILDDQLLGRGYFIIGENVITFYAD